MRALALTVVLGAAVIAAATGVFAADEPKILGQDAPAIDTKDFIQSDGRTAVADFKGEVLFIECFATW
jgi:hypothetical protein